MITGADPVTFPADPAVPTSIPDSTSDSGTGSQRADQRVWWRGAVVHSQPGWSWGVGPFLHISLLLGHNRLEIAAEAGLSRFDNHVAGEYKDIIACENGACFRQPVSEF
jgi:hypothetical protein